MIHCDNLETLEYSQDSFLQQLLWRISQNYSLTKTVFRLRSLFLTVNKPSMLVNLVRSLPRLEELTIWSEFHTGDESLAGWFAVFGVTDLRRFIGQSSLVAALLILFSDGSQKVRNFKQKYPKQVKIIVIEYK